MSGSLESVRWNACAHRLVLGLHSHPKEFLGNGVRTHAHSKGKIPSAGKILLREGSNPRHCIKQDSEHLDRTMTYYKMASSGLNPSYCMCCHTETEVCRFNLLIHPVIVFFGRGEWEKGQHSPHPPSPCTLWTTSQT